VWARTVLDVRGRAGSVATAVARLGAGRYLYASLLGLVTALRRKVRAVQKFGSPPSSVRSSDVTRPPGRSMARLEQRRMGLRNCRMP
jgi:hypothetical protein